MKKLNITDLVTKHVELNKNNVNVNVNINIDLDIKKAVLSLDDGLNFIKLHSATVREESLALRFTNVLLDAPYEEFYYSETFYNPKTGSFVTPTSLKNGLAEALELPLGEVPEDYKSLTKACATYAAALRALQAVIYNIIDRAAVAAKVPFGTMYSQFINSDQYLNYDFTPFYEDGMLALDVEEILPVWVTTSETGTRYLSLSTSDIAIKLAKSQGIKGSLDVKIAFLNNILNDVKASIQ